MMTLRNAVRAAIAHDNTIHNICVDRWAATYRCEPADVFSEWERQMTTKSLQASPPMEFEGK